MSEDRTLLGDGPYPVTGPLAVLGRLAFLAALLAIVVAKFLPSRLVPDFVQSNHLQHFAAFYVASLFGLAAMARSSVRKVALGLVIFATVIEVAHLIAGASLQPLIDNWVADMGGLLAAFAPVLVERFRRRMRRVET